MHRHSSPQTVWEYNVLDGGSLFYRLHWPRGSTFGGLSALHVDFVQRHYMPLIIVVDGYGTDPFTTDMAHLRRSWDVVGTSQRQCQHGFIIKKGRFSGKPCEQAEIHHQ
eukprot:TRINITY_DN92194_c0_g2_i1.p1 TRINITY_DN92194_c0_g2~~TRINITY_DN92194_c0_g2_i1.p1  ORF type:complete len:109 (+),score=19.56 TRINITY_DN92194_c0_g2_i1:95-421(+)